MNPPTKTTSEAIADAQHRLDTILMAGHTQMINVRADTLRVLIAAAQEQADAEARKMMTAAQRRKLRNSMRPNPDFKIFTSEAAKLAKDN